MFKMKNVRYKFYVNFHNLIHETLVMERCDFSDLEEVHWTLEIIEDIFWEEFIGQIPFREWLW